MIDTTQCQMCPGDEDEGCCIINLDTYDFACDVCESIDGQRECARVACGLTDDDGYGCNGCGDYSSGKACFDFACSGAEEGQESECVCNSITWNGQSCGQCSIDSEGNPQFDCGKVNGPNSSVGEPSGSAAVYSSAHYVGGAVALLVVSVVAVIANLM